MIIALGRCKLIKFLLVIVAIFKIIRENIFFNKLFYSLRNILMQYLFICFTKFANVIFWFFVMKKIEFPKKTVIPKKEDNKIIEETKEIKDTNIEKKKNIRITSIGLSQKEINLNEKEKILKKRYYKEIFYLIFSSIMDFLANIFYFFSIPYIANDLNKENKTNSKNVLLEYIIDSYSNNIRNKTENNTNNNTHDEKEDNDNLVNLIPFRIMFRVSMFFLFFELFLHFEKIHRHQFISLLSIILISLLVYFEYFKVILEKQNHFLLYHLPISFFQELTFCLYNAIGAKYLSISNGNVYKLLFFNGLFGIIMLFVINFLKDFIHCSELHIDENFCNNNKLKPFYEKESLKIYKYKDYIIIPITVIMSIIEMAFMWLLILYQTVNHLSVACAIHLFYRFIFGKKVISSNHYIFGISCLVFIFFFTLVFNEIIILRFCSLDKNTKEEIEKRAIDDKTLGEILSVDSSMDGTVNENS